MPGDQPHLTANDFKALALEAGMSMHEMTRKKLHPDEVMALVSLMDDDEFMKAAGGKMGNASPFVPSVGKLAAGAKVPMPQVPKSAPGVEALKDAVRELKGLGPNAESLGMRTGTWTAPKAPPMRATPPNLHRGGPIGPSSSGTPGGAQVEMPRPGMPTPPNISTRYPGQRGMPDDELMSPSGGGVKVKQPTPGPATPPNLKRGRVDTSSRPEGGVQVEGDGVIKAIMALLSMGAGAQGLGPKKRDLR